MAHQVPIDRICRLIDAMLPGGYPAIDDIAQLLGVSARTLQRALGEAGVSYSDLVERCRCTAARDSLEKTRKSIKDIAASLGYRDASSFSRAFRRWTGRTPRAYRNQSLSPHRGRSTRARGAVNAPR